MKTRGAVIVRTTRDEQIRALADEIRRAGGGHSAAAARARLATLLRQDGFHDERSVEELLRGLEPGGEERILPGETRGDAIARLQRHYGYSQSLAEKTIALSEGWSDIRPVDDDGNDLPIGRMSPKELAEWGLE